MRHDFSPHREEVLLREIREGEEELLKAFLYEAIFVPEGTDPPPREILEKPELQVYVSGFGRGEADAGFVAEVGGRPVGAAWARIMEDYGHLDDETPSLAIALYPEVRGKGIGTALLKALLSKLKEMGYQRASLSVQRANRARHLYERTGFVRVVEEGEEWKMVCEL